MSQNRKVLRMVFATANGGSFTISVDKPKATLTTSQIEGVMDSIISKNIFQTVGGDLVGKKDAKIIDTTTNDMYDPA